MTRGRGVGVNPETGLNRSMTIGELDDIRGQKAEAESTLKHLTENPGAVADGVDKAKLQRDINRYDTILHAGAPKQVRGLNKDNLAKEAVRLREAIRENMPTREEMDHPAKNPGAVQKHIMWNKRNRENLDRYKQIQRQLEPDNPTATSVENLRRVK